MRKFGLSTLAALAVSFLSAQYTSGVTIPETGQPVKNDEIYRASLSITPEDLSRHLYVIASDSFGGRELGTEGNAMAAEYISANFERLGLQTLPGMSSYFQEVDFSWINWTDISMEINDAKYKQLWDFVAFQDRNKGGVIQTEDVVFLGYGIDDPEYSDYKKAKSKVNGEVILIYDGEPKDKKGNYRISRDTHPSDWSSDLNQKLEAAHKYGVRHVLIIAQNIQKMVEDHRKELLGSKVFLGKPDQNEAAVDYTYISSTMAKAILGEKTKKVIRQKECISKKGKSRPIVTQCALTITQEKSLRHVGGVNIAGMIKGSTKPDEYVVLSAHYDHIGKKGRDINNGADDNGSGTSSMIEIAEAYSLEEKKGILPQRSVIFMLVTGEEKGLLGSSYYVNHPIVPLDQTMVDINIDMVGRVHESYKDNPNYIFVIGSDRMSTELHTINEKVNQDYSHLTLDYRYNAESDPNRFYYRSDHYNFAQKGVPAIFFFNGTHEDYHRPTDTPDKINYRKMAEVARHIFRLSYVLADEPERIEVDK